MIIQDEDEVGRAYSEALDRSLQSAVGKLSHGISPAALMLAFFDWYFHLMIHPAKQWELTELHQQYIWHFFSQYYNHLIGDLSGEFCVLLSPQDKRFIHPEWQKFPYSVIYQS